MLIGHFSLGQDSCNKFNLFFLPTFTCKFNRFHMCISDYILFLRFMIRVERFMHLYMQFFPVWFFLSYFIFSE